MIDRVSINNQIEEESTSIPIYEREFNISDPNGLVRFPGFGLWPYWYLEKFKNRKEIWEKASNMSTKDENVKVTTFIIISIGSYKPILFKNEQFS